MVRVLKVALHQPVYVGLMHVNEVSHEDFKIMVV